MMLDQALLERFMNTEPATYGHFPGVNFMDAGIKPINRFAKMVGPAFTVRLIGKDSAALYKALKIAPPSSVLVIDRAGDLNFAAVGEMVARNAKARGFSGIVVDGAVTDSLALETMDFPVFCRSISVATTNVWGISGEYGVPIQCGNTPVQNDDLILGNADGVVVIKNKNYLDLLEKAEAIEAREVIMRERFAHGIDQLLDVDPLLDAKILSIINEQKEKGRPQ